VLVGYEWLMSGVTKMVRGDFPSGLADELREKSEGLSGWYKSFLDGTVIPNASGFAYAFETASCWSASHSSSPRLSGSSAGSDCDNGRLAVLAATALASVGGIFMAVNFHLANSAAHPWLIPADGFDEGIDLDSLLPAIQLVLVGVSVGLWRELRRTQHAEQQTKPVHPLERSLT
jgi:hypothetical protein